MMHLIWLSKLNTTINGPSLRRALIGQTREMLTSLSCHNPTTTTTTRILNNYPAAVGATLSSLNNKLATSSGSHSLYNNFTTAAGCGGGHVVYFTDKTARSCRKASISLRHRNVLSTQLGFVVRGPCLRRFHVSCSQSNGPGPGPGSGTGTGTAASIPLDDEEKQYVKSSDSDSCGQVEARGLKLNSASCYLPHPDKVKTGGEDAHFICEEKQVIGVADGVGGWADVGVDAGLYSRMLMDKSVSALKEEEKGSVDPAKVLEKAHAGTEVMGSSTACIVALTNKGIHAINLGDSAFLVIRDGSTVFRSPVQQYGFNFPYQLANGNGGDVPSSGQVFSIPVASGDVIVVGTDGLFDNLYDNEIAALVVQATRSGLEPQFTAQNIAALAQTRALDRQRQTPFAAAAHDAGFRYIGGKLDDITVVVSYITDENNQ